MVRLTLILLCFFLATPAWGKIYKWVDEKGKTHFTDDLRKVPADQRPEMPSQPVPRIPRPSVKKESAEKSKKEGDASSKTSAGGSSSSKSTSKVINITIEECGNNIRQGKSRSHLDTLLDTSQCKKKTIAKAVSAWKCETGPNQERFCENQLASFCSRRYTCVEETENYSRAKFSKENEAIQFPSDLVVP
jgi:hypothetical protein